MTNEILKKFDNGDSLTDQECKDLSSFFADLEEKLTLLGPEYGFARWAIMRNKMAVDSYLLNRGLC